MSASVSPSSRVGASGDARFRSQAAYRIFSIVANFGGQPINTLTNIPPFLGRMTAEAIEDLAKFAKEETGFRLEDL